MQTGRESKIYIREGSSTLIGSQPFYDEKGIYHDHNPNSYIQHYACSNGHHWIESVKVQCPNCDWGEN
jgi:hypothetical protein